MKIGIISLPMTWNYGGILQQYALQKLLHDYGHEVEILTIRKDRENIILNFVVALKWQMIKIINKVGIKGISKLIDTEYYKNNFLGEISKSLFSETDITNYLEKKQFECLIVGSDQIWNRTALPNLNASFLNYPAKLKLAYAPSFAKSYHEYSDEEVEFVINALRNFDYISVRETSGKNILKDVFFVDSEVVFDPTLLLKIEDYYVDDRIKSETIFSYVLDSSDYINNCLSIVSELLNLKVHDFVRDSGYKGVETWLGGIKNSKFVLTDSFHGFCFSVLSNTEFIVIRNKSRGSDRFDSLAEIIGLSDRIIDENELYKIQDIVLAPIDWNKVNTMISTHANKSRKFLKCLN